jgi:hypothetical protein
MNRNENGVPLEVFIQALTSQLDRAQDALRLKASAERPLTFAVKDLTLDLRSHLDMSGSVVRIRPAGPGEPQASTIRLSLTTITRPMIEENTVQLAAEPDEPTLKEVLGTDVSEEEKEDFQRRLEWAGIHTVSQLRDLRERSTPELLERVTQLPVHRLRAALMKASEPRITRITPEAAVPEKSIANVNERRPPVLRIEGRNLLRGGTPDVRIRGERVAVLKANNRELLLAPTSTQLAGTLSIETEPGNKIETELMLEPPPTPEGKSL